MRWSTPSPREDGQPLAEDLEPLGNGVLPLTFDRADTSVGVIGGSHGSAYFYDADPSEPSIQYVEKTTSDVPLEPGTATATFRNLYLMGKEFQDNIPVAEGNWKIRFQFSFPDSSVRLPGGQTFQLNGMEAVLDGVTISPLSIQVDYTVKESWFGTTRVKRMDGRAGTTGSSPTASSSPCPSP